MGEIPMSNLDKHFAAGLEGTEYTVSATPQGRNSEYHADRPECCGNASCIPVCPIQAKYDATVHVAQAAGAKVYDQTTATRLNLGDNAEISSVSFRRADGSEGTASGKVVVVAAHGIETPCLLLNSARDGAPNGVANSSDQVGRNLMDHPTKLSYAEAAEPICPTVARCRRPALKTCATGISEQIAVRSASKSAMTDTAGPRVRL